MSSVSNTNPSFFNRIKPVLPNNNEVLSRGAYATIGSLLIHAMPGGNDIYCRPCAVASYLVASVAKASFEPLSNAIIDKALSHPITKKLNKMLSELQLSKDLERIQNVKNSLGCVALETVKIALPVLLAQVSCSLLGYRMNLVEVAFKGYFVPFAAKKLHDSFLVEWNKRGPKVDAYNAELYETFSKHAEQQAENLSIASETDAEEESPILPTEQSPEYLSDVITQLREAQEAFQKSKASQFPQVSQTVPVAEIQAEEEILVDAMPLIPGETIELINEAAKESIEAAEIKLVDDVMLAQMKQAVIDELKAKFANTASAE